jgi:bla regulator protein blaR1
MSPEFLSEPWTVLAPALGDHLWQRTLFAGAAGGLTLVLRENHARIRYWLWLVASLKFLVPFSLLIGIGSHLVWIRSAAGAKARLYFVMNEVGQSFARPTSPAGSMVFSWMVSPTVIHFLSAFLVGVWLSGFVVVPAACCWRWSKVSAAVREATPLEKGREVERYAGWNVPDGYSGASGCYRRPLV